MNTPLNADDLMLSSERRESTRGREQASAQVLRDGVMTGTPLIEYSGFGARMVLSNAVVGQTVDFVIETSRHNVIGRGRVAWTSPLSNGRSVSGVEFLEVRAVAREALAA